MVIAAHFLVGVAVVATVVFAAAASRASALPGPPLATPQELLDRAIECSAGVDNSIATPVLLVHGTWTNPEETWSWGYRRVLPSSGTPVCTVSLPDNAMGDVQRSVEYVVYAIRQLARRAGRNVSVIAHSQGALLSTLALRFWPDLAFRVDDFVGLAGVYGDGSTYMDFDCQRVCPPAEHQMRPASRLLQGYRSRPLPDAPSYTSILTLTDELVTPQPRASSLAGARNVVIQDFCGYLRPIDHIAILGDAVTHAIAIDALAHPGAADPARVSRATCLQPYMPGADVTRSLTRAPTFLATLTLPSSRDTDREPRLHCYLDRTCKRPRLRPTLRASTNPRRDLRPPWSYMTTGALELPTGALDRCSGTVIVRIKYRSRKISQRRAAIRDDCRFSSRVTLGRSRSNARRTRGPLRLRVRFTGNHELLPASAPEYRLRFG